MDKVKAVKAQLRLQQWAERISECQASSMTVVAWCEAHDINIYGSSRISRGLVTGSR